MADNTTTNAGAGGDTFATDDIGGVKWPRVKVTFGVDGAAADVSAAAPLPVSLTSTTVTGSVAVTGPLTDTQLRASSVPVTASVSNFPANQAGAADITSAGTIAAAAQTVAIALNGQSAASIQITGAWVGTLQFEGTTDGTTWSAINGVFAGASTPGPTITANGLVRLTPAGLAQLRINATAWTSGTATITIRATTAVGGTFLNQSLTAGTNLIGKVGIDQTTLGTTNRVDVGTINGVAPAFNTGVRGATVQRMTLATDDVIGITQSDTAVSGTISATDILASAPAGGGVLINTTPTVNSYVFAAVPGGTAQADIQITGTATGTYYFEASMDSTTGADGNWIAVNYRQTGISNTVLGYSTTAVGVYRGAPSGFKYIRVRNVGGTTPSNPIIFRYSNGSGTTFLNASIPAGSNAIGSITNTSFGATLAAETTKVIGTVNVAASQTIAVTQATGTNLHVVSDTGSTTAVTGNVTVVQPTGTNLHAVLDTGSTTAVTQATPANLQMSATQVVGSAATRWFAQISDGTTSPAIKAASTAAATADPSIVVAMAGANSATKIGDGTNNAAIKAASTAAAATDPALTVAISPNNSVAVTQATAANLNATVAQGTAAAIGNSWYAKLSDGTTGPVAVKAASTAAAFTDIALTADVRPGGALVTASAALADALANPTLGKLAMLSHVYNGTTWDLQRGMGGNATTGDTGAKTATGNGATQTNVGNKGIQIVLNMGTVTGTTPTFVMKVQGSVDGGTNWYDVPGATTASLVATGLWGIMLYPGAAVTAGTTVSGSTAGASGVIPRTWRVVWTIGGTTPSFTITSISYNYIPN